MDPIKEAASALLAGEVVIFPTETVYGLGAAISQPEAIRQIFSLKGRPNDNPIIVHVSDLEQALSLIETPPEAFFRLAEQFWPGPLTMVLKKRKSVSDWVSAGLPTIAIRMPSHKTALELISLVGPIAAPSANLSGKPSPTCLHDALEDLGSQVRISLDGGDCLIGIESTVIHLLDSKPVLLRPGHITASQIEEVLNCPLQTPPQQGPILSPGMKYRHYAPKAAVRLVYDEKDLKGTTTLRSLKPHQLYAALRRCDRENASEIEILCDSTMRKDPALMDRLLRASAAAR